MKYLSKLLSMFLVGMMLVATGCTDYDQDIKNLQNDVNELESQLNGKLATLDTKLDTVKESLTGAINAAKEELDGKLKTAVEDLKAADQKNETAIDAANKEIAAAVTRIATLETQLAALTKDLEDLEGKHDADITAVRNELATQIAAVNTKIAEEVAKVNKAIEEANEKIAANEDAIDALEEKDVELAKSINDAFDAIEKNAEAIEKNAEAIQKNADDILANANAISVNADAIDALESSLLELTNNYAAYKAATDAAIAVLESRMATAEAAIVELEKAVEELYSLHDVQGALIENLDGRLEEFMQYVEDQFAVLAAADKALNDLIVNLENSFIDYQKIVNEQFTKAFAQIGANTAAINALAAKHEEEVKSLMAQDAAILATLDQHVAWMVELEESISAVSDRVGATEALIGKIQTNIAAMQVSIDALVNDVAELEKTLADFQKQVGEQIARIDAAIKSALVEAKEYTDARHEEAKGMIEALQTTVERELATIKSTLDEVSAYAKAIDQKLYEYIQTNNKALEGLRKTIEEVKADLINNHIKPLETKLDEFIANVKSSLANIESQFSAINDAIVALKEVDNRQDAAIKKATEDILANLAEINTLKSQLGELEGKHDADIADLREELTVKLQTKVDEILAALEKVETDLWDALSGHEKRLNGIDGVIEEFKGNFETLAETIKTIQDTISGIKGQLGKVETTIGAMQTSIDILTSDLLKLNESFVAYQAKTNAAIDTLNGRMETAETAIGELEKAVANLYTLHGEQQAILDGHTTDIDAIKKFVIETTATLTKVAEQISTLEANLGKLSDHVDDIYAELTKAIGENAVQIQQISAELKAEIAARKADDTAIKEAMKEYLKQMATFVKEHTANELNALEEKINKRISELEKRVGELETNLANLEKAHNELNQTVKDAIENLTTLINNAIETAAADAQKKADAAEENAKKFAEELAIELSEKLDAVKGHLTNVEAFAKQTKNELDEYKKATDAILDDLQNQINEIKNRVQSIVFVPEYSDGKGTINYAMAGQARVESRSMMVYQVYPADCAAAIADAFNKNPESLTYNFEGLKTRSSEPEFNIVEVKPGSTGRLFVTFETRNLSEDFYAGKMEYALSLVHHTEIVNLSTVYTNVVPAAEYDEISMAIMYGDKEISGRYNLPDDGPMYKFEYTDTETVVEVLPEHYVAFTVAGKTYKGIKELKDAGYAIELNCANYIKRLNNEHLGTKPFAVTDADTNGILEVKVAEVDGGLIYQPIYVGYTYTAGTLKAEVYSVYVTSPVQSDINFEAVSANWTYSKDANVDANKSGAYTRVLPLTVVDHNLPADVKSVADVIALTPESVKVTLDGEETSVAAKLIAKGEEMFLEIANFAWDKTYDIEAKYSVMMNGEPVVEATAKVAFNTTDRNREPITINFDPAVAKFERNLQLTNDISDNMDVAYELLVFGNDNYDIDCEKYLADNFVAGYTYVDALIADGKEVAVDASFNTMLAIDGVNNGKNIYTAFCYADFNFVPAQVEYTKTVTTWYGQEFIINKVLNFEFPVYDFKHNSKYVYGGGVDFYSQVQPEYTWNNDDEAQGLLKFDVAAVDLRAAFSVVDAEGKTLSNDQLAALSLSYNFEIEDNNHDGIEINTNDELSYYGANPFVNVRGNLVITNDNGAKYVVPTSFDNGGKYASYNVVKFNPIGTAEVISNPTVKVNNSIAYTLHILDYVKLMDHRTGGRQNYDLITDGAWVSGNGLNGFAEGVDVRANYMYRITETWVDDYSDVDPEIRPYITMNNGTLTFDNSQQLELTAPFTIPVTLKFQNCWMETPQQVTVKVTFNPIK